MGLLSVLLECVWVSEMRAVKWSVKFGGFDCLQTHACDLITGAELKLQEEKMSRRKRKKKVERWRADRVMIYLLSLYYLASLVVLGYA